MKKVIVTGANGFVGTHLVKLFSSRGYKVYALVKENSDNSILEKLENIEIIQFDLEQINNIERLLPHDVDILYHLAWVGVSTTLKNQESIQLKNIEYSLNILKLAKKLEVKKIVYPGSISEYAYCEVAVTGEEAPSPADSYSASKISTHYVCDIYARQNNLNFNWALIPSIYGPGREDNNLVTYTIKSLLKGKSPDFTKLEQKWDYIYIDDLMEALYSIGNQGINGVVYPIGTGENKHLSYYVKIIRNIIDESIPLGIGNLPYKTDRIDNSIVDITKIQRDTNFVPKYSFVQGIKKTIKYYKNKEETKNV